MIYPTKLGSVIVAVGAFLYLASLQTHSGLLFLLLGLVFGCYLVNLIEAYRCVRRLRLVPPSVLTGCEGESVAGTWAVENPTRGTTGLVDVRGPWGPFFAIGAVAAGETSYITPKIGFGRRGVYPFSILRLTSGYPFGLLRATRRLECPGEVVVHPAVYPCRAPVAAGFEPMLGGHYTGKHRTSSGDQFHGVRPMQPHDAVKLIHWPSSSKGQGLMVREFDEELSGRTALIVAGDDQRDGDDGLYLDWVARAAGSLMLAALDHGYQVEYIDVQSFNMHAVPPFVDGASVLDALARLQPVPACITPANLERAVRMLPRKSSIAFVLSSLNSDSVSFINDLAANERRPITVYIPVDAECAAEELCVPVVFFHAQGMDE